MTGATVADALPPRLDPKTIEEPLYRSWTEAGYFHVEPGRVKSDAREPYVIVIPPPNVTAVLHMGHGLNNTIQDVMVRLRRMQGRASLWVPGTDHAGIATQNIVERQLAAEGATRHDLGREAFVERVWEHVKGTGGQILEQLKVIGASCDFERTRFTLDEGLSRAVREVFVHLYEKDLVYRGEYIINWCPRCLTALSNEEAEGEETQGRLYHLRYPVAAEAEDSAARAAEAAQAAQGVTEASGGESRGEPSGEYAIGQLPDGRWYITVSTTRPETMLGDTGVAVSPNDERYAALIGADVELPLTGRTIPIIADELVDPRFASGIVKVTPAHDPNDFEMAQRADLPILDVMTAEATMNEQAPEAFRGLDRFEARKRVVAEFEALGLYGGEEVHSHSVPHCYRCHTVVEPRLSLQWFVRMKPLAEPALEASRDGTISFTPPHWKKVYETWMENIRDWCISRQLWWGHRIPVWYCQSCEATIVARDDPDGCTSCGGTDLVQDPDVLDTWFSSWAVALLRVRVAGGDRRPRGLLSDARHGHGTGYPVFLGGSYDHGRLRVHGRSALHAGLSARDRSGQAGAQDVEVPRQRRRSDRGRRSFWRGCAPVLLSFHRLRWGQTSSSITRTSKPPFRRAATSPTSFGTPAASP